MRIAPQSRLQLPGLATCCDEAAPDGICWAEFCCLHVPLHLQGLIHLTAVGVRLDQGGVGVLISLQAIWLS